MQMRRIRFEAGLEYDADLIHGDDPEGIAWFYRDILGRDHTDPEGLILHSNDVGDSVGTLRVLRHIGEG